MSRPRRTPFIVVAPNNFPRQDLVAAFVTGIPGLNPLGFGEMQRLNTSIAPVPPEVLCHAFPGAFGCGPEDAPSGDLPYTDGAFVDASFFDASFPYLRSPIPGSPREARPE